jgi:hypothetical protein
VYEKLVTANKYPLKKPFFEFQQRQRTAFGKILEDEIYVVTSRNPEIDDVEEQRIFLPLPESVWEEKLSSLELDRWIVGKEQLLIHRYQDVLLHTELPNTTSAILQAQAELLNNRLKKLEMDLIINSRTETRYLT